MKSQLAWVAIIIQQQQTPTALPMTFILFINHFYYPLLFHFTPAPKPPPPGANKQSAINQLTFAASRAAPLSIRRKV